MKIVIHAEAREISQLLKDIVVGVTKEAEERIEKSVKRCEAAAEKVEFQVETEHWSRPK